MPTYENESTAGSLNEEYGFLEVQVFTATGGIPIDNAQVVISRIVDGEEILVQVLYTNENGKTEKLTLPAPPKILSLSPGYQGDVYSIYNIRTSKEGFNPVKDLNVPIFSGQSSIQPVNMLPLEENSPEFATEEIFEYEPSSL